MIAGRLERGRLTARPGIDPGSEPVPSMLRRFSVDAIVHDRGALELAERAFGAERMFFGSDWPFPMGIADPGQQLEDAPPALKDRIFSNSIEL